MGAQCCGSNSNQNEEKKGPTDLEIRSCKKIISFLKMVTIRKIVKSYKEK